jgi:hypothetical protein
LLFFYSKFDVGRLPRKGHKLCSMFIMYVDWPKLKPTPKIVQAPSGENVTGGATEGKGKDSSDAGGHAAPETAPGPGV